MELSPLDGSQLIPSDVTTIDLGATQVAPEGQHRLDLSFRRDASVTSERMVDLSRPTLDSSYVPPILDSRHCFSMTSRDIKRVTSEIPR
jgi:hypothetical protein